MERIDAHAHYMADHPEAIALLDSFHVKLLNVCVAPGGDADQRRSRAKACRAFQALSCEDPEHFAWCTTFEPPGIVETDYDDPTYVDRVIAILARGFAAGAVGCKFWKNIGMVLRKPDGSFLMIDDPIFDPIYIYLTREGQPALMHIAEPLACWRSLDWDSPHRDYYKARPEWHMYTKPDHPSHEQLMDARDRVLARHPDLRVIGAHLGSLEFDVSQMAQRLERYANFAVDTSARLGDLARQDSATVRQFVIDYQDRVIWGADIVQREPVSGMNDVARSSHLAAIRGRYQTEFTYYETTGQLNFQGREVRCLGLPDSVLRKVFYDNARTWFPGLA